MNKEKKIGIYFLIGVLALESFFIVFFNLTQLQYHLGHDTSVYLFQTIESWRQKSLLLEQWEYQTTFAIDSPVILAVFFYGICGNIFISYGLSNIVFAALFGIVFMMLLKRFDMSSESRLICLNIAMGLHLVPVFSNYNNLDYGSVMFVQNGAYVLKTIIALLIMIMMIDLARGKRVFILGIITAFLLFWTSISSGFWLFSTAVVPLIIYRAYIFMCDKKLKELVKDKAFRILTGFALICVAGQIIMTYVLGNSTIDSSMRIINTFRFWGNIGTMIVAFFRIVGGMTTARMNILSAGGVCVSLYFVLTVLLIVAGGFVTKKKRNEKPEHQIILSVFWGNLILFTICDTRWGDDNFSYRYLIVAFLITVICLGLFLDDVLYEKWGRGFLVISMAVCLLVVNTYSFLLIYNEKNNYEDLMEMAEFFDSKDPEVVLFYGDKTVYVDGRNLRVLDLTKVYKTVLTGDDFPTHIGDTLKYDYDYEGSYIIVSKKDDFNSLPAHVREGSSILSEDLKGYYVVQYDGSIPEFF